MDFPLFYFFIHIAKTFVESFTLPIYVTRLTTSNKIIKFHEVHRTTIFGYVFYQ